MLSRKRGFRAMALGLLAAAGLAMAPAAFAHGSVSIGVSVPGVSIGYGPYYGGYYGYPAYYAPAPVYYGGYYPYYYGPSVYYSYYGYPHHHYYYGGHYHGGYYGHSHSGHYYNHH